MYRYLNVLMRKQHFIAILIRGSIIIIYFAVIIFSMSCHLMCFLKGLAQAKIIKKIGGIILAS